MLYLRLWVIFQPHSYVALSSRKLCGDAKLRGHIKAGNPTPLSNHVQDSVRLCIGPDLFLSPLPLAKHSHSPPPTHPRSSTPGTKITQFRLSNINFLWCKMGRKCQQAFTFRHASANPSPRSYQTSDCYGAECCIVVLIDFCLSHSVTCSEHRVQHMFLQSSG